MRHFVYMLECSDGTLYTGYSTDVDRRVRQHNTGRGARYTRSRTPVKLTFKEEFRSRGQALRREFQIKKMRRNSKLLLCAGYPPKQGQSPS
ncbi:MAG: GIY-YIG nuclease family protein [Nitrososphaerales archaeon]